MIKECAKYRSTSEYFTTVYFKSCIYTFKTRVNSTEESMFQALVEIIQT